MIVDANDFNVEILGASDSITLSEETLKALIKDNPAGQAKTLTPIILIRKAEEKDDVPNAEEKVVDDNVNNVNNEEETDENEKESKLEE